jgi:FimV-like protein
LAKRAGVAEESKQLARAQTAMRKGDYRTARSLAADVVAHGDEREREQARRILASLSPDRAALLAAACVLLVIALAAILALFRAH